MRNPFCVILRRYRDFCDGRHLVFLKFWYFNGRSTVRGQHASLYQISSNSVKRLQRYGDLTVFLSNGRPPSWIRWARIGTTLDDNLMVSIVVQNLVEIDAVVSITWNFQYFACLAWKRLFTPWKLRFSENFTPKMESNAGETPKRHILVRVRVVWAIKPENPSTGLTCRRVDEKGINK